MIPKLTVEIFNGEIMKRRLLLPPPPPQKKKALEGAFVLSHFLPEYREYHLVTDHSAVSSGAALHQMVHGYL